MNGLTHSQLLRNKIALVSGPLKAALDAVYDHPAAQRVYPEHLFVINCISRSGVSLMEAAIHRAQSMTEKDPVADQLAEYLVKHIPEEKNHDLWALQDLGVLGWRRNEVLKRQPYAAIAAMVGAQYYWIYHYHPIALLGFLAVLEGYPQTVQEVEAQIARTGLPREAFRFLLRHARLDQRHRDDIFATLDRLPLSPDHTALLGVSAMQTVDLMSQTMRQVLEHCETSRVLA